MHRQRNSSAHKLIARCFSEEERELLKSYTEFVDAFAKRATLDDAAATVEIGVRFFASEKPMELEARKSVERIQKAVEQIRVLIDRSRALHGLDAPTQKERKISGK